MFFIEREQGNMYMSYKYNDKNIMKFDVDYILGARSKTQLDTSVRLDSVFKIMNSYIDSKSDKFRKDLYNTYVSSTDIIGDSLLNSRLDPLPESAIHQLIDVFDIDDLSDFIEKKFAYIVPGMLSETYNKDIELNDDGSREQTYLRKEFYRLVALINILRIAVLPIGDFGSKKQALIANPYKEYILMHFFLSHKISGDPAFVKLLAYINKLLDIAVTNKESFSKLIIEKGVSELAYPDYLLGLVIFQKFILHNETIDVNEKNLITKLYTFIRNKVGLKPISSSSSANKITIRSVTSSTIANVGDIESTLETFRVPSDVSLGHMEEFKFVFKDADRLLLQLMCVDVDLLEEVLPYFRSLADKEIPLVTIHMLSWITKDVIDPRSVEYVDADSIIVGLAVAYVKLIKANHHELALLLTTFTVRTDSFRLGVTAKRKLTPENKLRLDKYFPNKLAVMSNANTVTGITYTNIIEHTITYVTNALSATNLQTILPSSLLDKNHNTTQTYIPTPPNIRNLLVDLVIGINYDVEDDDVEDNV